MLPSLGMSRADDPVSSSSSNLVQVHKLFEKCLVGAYVDPSLFVSGEVNKD